MCNCGGNKGRRAVSVTTRRITPNTSPVHLQGQVRQKKMMTTLQKQQQTFLTPERREIERKKSIMMLQRMKRIQ